MVANFEVTVDVKDKDSFLNDLYQVMNAYVIFYTMLSINIDKITISIDEEDLAFLALRHKLHPCRVNDALRVLSNFQELH